LSSNTPRPPARIEPIARWRIWTARLVAVSADGLQLLIFPLFSPGAVSPADDALDVVAAAALIFLIGWHWAFLPGFIAELVPGLDLVPTWTLAVLIATGKRRPKVPPATTVETIERNG
jgi:hypothetical protein